jgi:hypothetical protein
LWFIALSVFLSHTRRGEVVIIFVHMGSLTIPRLAR